jgi:N-acetylneuraminate synthase
MDMNDLKLLRSRIDTMGELIGSSAVSSLSSEDSARKNARRSLVAQKRIPKGKIIASDDLTWKRPASGISPKDIASVIGKSAATDIEEDETLKWELLDD